MFFKFLSLSVIHLFFGENAHLKKRKRIVPDYLIFLFIYYFYALIDFAEI